MKDFKVYQTSGMLNFLVSEASDVRKKEQTLSGDIVSFSADEQSPLKIVVDIDSTGWTGCEVNRTGVNVWDEEWEVGALIENGTVDSSLSSRRTTSFIPVVPSTTYSVVNGFVIGGRCAFYDKSKNIIAYSGDGISSFTFTTPANAYYLRITIQAAYGTTYNNDISINYPSTDTDYHAYTGTTLSVTFPDEVGSVTDGLITINYDGSVILETGGQTYTLTSTSPIEALIGDNNIWADAGPVSVTYPI